MIAKGARWLPFVAAAAALTNACFQLLNVHGRDWYDVVVVVASAGTVACVVVEGAIVAVALASKQSGFRAVMRWHVIGFAVAFLSLFLVWLTAEKNGINPALYTRGVFLDRFDRREGLP